MMRTTKFDYYQELEVDATAPLADIVSAYRRLSRIHHPDKTTCDKEAAATAKMARLNHARDVLANAEKRRKYDEMLREGLEQEQAMGDEDVMAEMGCDEVPEDDPARYAPVEDPTLEGDVSGDFGLGGYGLWEQQHNRAGQASESDKDEDKDEDEEVLDQGTPASPEGQVEVQPQPELYEQLSKELVGPTLDALEVEERLEKEEKEAEAKKSLWQTLVEDINDTKRRTKERGLLPESSPTPSAALQDNWTTPSRHRQDTPPLLAI